MSGSRLNVSRRDVLRGIGVGIALPWLESIVPSAARASAASDAPPLRLAFAFVPNGVHLPNWTPPSEGFGFQLPYILEPLAGVQDDLLVLSGLTHDKGRANGDGAGDHARSASVFLTGAQPRKVAGANIRSGISVDQLAAQQIGQHTKFPSLELGCEPGRSAGGCDSGYSCAYSSSISWSGETTPMGKETNPRSVFERLFSTGGGAKVDKEAARRQALKKSVLDFISDDAKRLQSMLGGNDNRKLDEYLTGVREIERRIEMSEADSSQVANVDVDYETPEGIPKDYAEHLRLMSDMMVLAFQTDSTRVSSFMFADAGSNRSYRQIDVPDGHHSLSHHRSDPKKLEKISKINRFHVTQFAYLVERLKAIPEGEGSLLDNCMICYGSGISDGNKHNNEDLPILLAGGGGGSIDSGRHVRYEHETPLCNLYMSMLDRAGASTDFIGDSTARLDGLQL